MLDGVHVNQILNMWYVQGLLQRKPRRVTTLGNRFCGEKMSGEMPAKGTLLVFHGMGAYTLHPHMGLHLDKVVFINKDTCIKKSGVERSKCRLISGKICGLTLQGNSAKLLDV